MRVSTGQQAADGISLDAQRHLIAQYCATHNLNLVETYADEGLSGRQASNRAGLEAALRRVEVDRGTLIVHSLSRLARNIIDAASISRRLRKADANLVTLDGEIDTTTAAGRLYFHIICSVAEFESDDNGERVAEALALVREKGRRYCLNAPYGYAYVDGEIVPNADEQKVARRIRRLRAKGWSYRRIARRLDETGVRNRRGNPLPFQAIATIDKQVEDGGIRRPAKRRRRG
ncbi:MAG: recombinase family protein [Planctomycetota bacterium]